MRKVDFLVIGSGIAGLSFALNVAKYGSVLLVTKKEDTESSTNYAQGGIAAVLDSQDSFETHISDTLRAGAGLCDSEAVEIMVKEGPDRIEELISRGVEFSASFDGKSKTLALGREGGHTKSRIVHRADHTGREVESRLIDSSKSVGSIEILEHATVIDLAVSENGKLQRCVGAFIHIEGREVEQVQAKITMLATGGAGNVYLHTTNPSIATGDGIAISYRAGVKIANLEFMQFHPTTLFPRSKQAFLISEAVRGFGGILRTRSGEVFMHKYHEMKDLAPRDIVARAIDNEMKISGDEHVYLDITSRLPDEIRERFPSIYKHCLSNNLDITREWIPVVPAAHYMCGGVITDLHGKTSLPGLYAAGEVAWSGVHGANRLASNSLLEAIVFSHRAADTALGELKEGISEPVECPLPANHVSAYNEEEWVLVAHDYFEVRQLMWDYVGIVRSNLRLERAKRRVDLIRREIESLYDRSPMHRKLVELRNIALIASLIIKCAQKRKESRGLHYTTDYPQTLEKAENTILYSRRRK